MSEVPKEQQAEEESAARKSKAAGRVIKERKDAGLMKAVGAGKERKAIAELAKAGAKIAGAKKAATKPNKPRHSEKDGAEMLKQASDQALVEITGDIVEKLKDAAKDGDVVCVKTLMSFSERKKPRAKVKRKSNLLKWIEEVEKERQWEGPPDYGDEEGEMQGIGTKGLRD
jgi:ornithine carbamoyltransferase